MRGVQQRQPVHARLHRRPLLRLLPPVLAHAQGPAAGEEIVGGVDRVQRGAEEERGVGPRGHVQAGGKVRGRRHLPGRHVGGTGQDRLPSRYMHWINKLTIPNFFR